MNAMRVCLAGGASLLMLAGCVSAPTGPSVMALPGSGKTFDQFRYDDFECREYARQMTGGTAQDAGTSAGVKSAAVGTAIGAVAGAAIGGRDGAGAGAATGLVFGSAAGAGAAQSTAYGTQRYFDHAYVQCMYAKGHQVPVSGGFTNAPSAVPATGGAAVPPPPPGNPPPPPPDARVR